MTRNAARSKAHITQVRCYSLSGGVLAEVSLDCPASFAGLRAALREKAPVATWREPSYRGRGPPLQLVRQNSAKETNQSLRFFAVDGGELEDCDVDGGDGINGGYLGTLDG